MWRLYARQVHESEIPAHTGGWNWYSALTQGFNVWATHPTQIEDGHRAGL